MKRRELSAVRSAAGVKGLASRWGERRGPSRTIRVSEEAFTALQQIPERERRQVASTAIISALRPQ